MLLQILITSFLFIVVWAYFKFFVLPRKEYERVIKLFQAKGYTIYKHPFKPLGAPFFQAWENDYHKHGDAIKVIKEEYNKCDVAVSNVITKIMVDLIHPDLVKQFYSLDNINNYHKLEDTRVSFSRIGEGLLFSEQNQWKKKRKVLNKVFNFSFVKNCSQKISKLWDQHLDHAQKTQSPNSEGQKTLPLLQLTTKFSGNVMLECFLGGNATEVTLEGKNVCYVVAKILECCFEQSRELLPLIFGASFTKIGLFENHRRTKRYLKSYHQWGVQYVNKRVQEEKEKFDKRGDSDIAPQNIIQAIIRSNAEEVEQDKKPSYTAKQIFEEFNVFFAAGTDTTSHFIAIMIYYTAQNKEVQAKVRQQIELYMKDDDFDYEDLKKMTYIDQVQKQTTRLYGPAIALFPRETMRDHYLHGIEVKKGTYMNVVQTGNNFNQKYFEDPYKFNPDRWSDGKLDNLPAYVYGGFSSGQRVCIGKQLAYLESKIAFIKFFKRYKHVEAPKQPIRYRMGLVYSSDQITMKVSK